MEHTRIPRPIGYTELAKIQHQSGTPNHTTLHNHIIHSYISTGFTFCGTPMDIPKLSRYTGIPADSITQAIIDYGANQYGQADPQDQGNILRALVGLSLSGALADRQAALEQYTILKASQGSGYKAFVTSEVNKALKLTMEGTKGILDIYRSLAGQQGLNVIINNENSQAVQHNYITTEKALELLQQESTRAPLLEHQEDREALYVQHRIDDMPEVNANLQRGHDTSKEGLNIQNIAKVSDGILPNEAPEGPPAEDALNGTGHGGGHIDRRASGMDIDLDADII